MKIIVNDDNFKFVGRLEKSGARFGRNLQMNLMQICITKMGSMH